jgi:hypothetical protein
MEIQSTVVASPKSSLPNEQGEYWRSGSTVRQRQASTNGVIDAVARDGVRRQLVAQRQAAPGNWAGASITPTANSTLDVDAWHAGLFTFDYDSDLTFDRLIGLPARVRDVKRVEVDGRQLYYVDVEAEITPVPRVTKKRRYEIWFDPEVNFLIRKRIEHSVSDNPATRGRPGRMESEVVAFQEVQPGLFFPQRIESGYYDAGTLTNKFLVTFDGTRGNPDFGEDDLSVTFPPGIGVLNTVQGTYYRVGANGQPVGEVKRLATATQAAGAATALPETTAGGGGWSLRGVFLAVLVPAVLLGAAASVRARLRRGAA